MWRRLRLGYRGHYSVERMCALSEYCEQTSYARVLLVITLFIIPSLTTTVLLDALPLQDPFSGWDKNTSFWIRVVSGTFTLGLGMMSQMQTLVPAADLTLPNCITVAVFSTFCFTTISVLVAKYWVFPIPFMMVVCSPPYSLGFFGTALAVIGKKKLTARPEIKSQLQRFSNLVNLSALFIVVYPVYNAIFRTLSGISQLTFLFVLPVIKHLLENVAKKVVADLEDVVPVLALTVDLFNALFQAKCMQNSGSIWTTVCIIAIDVMQNLVTLRRLFLHMKEVQVIISNEVGSKTLLSIGVRLIATPSELVLDKLRVESWTEVHLSKEKSALVQNLKLEQTKDRAKINGKISLHRFSSDVSMSALNTVVPWPSAAATRNAGKQESGGSVEDAYVPRSLESTRIAPLQIERKKSHGVGERSDNTIVMKKTLQLLSRCEAVLLVEYIEAIVPLMYGLSLSILHLLPNARYYPP
uniref:Uncharacterized protein n=1 Tax=Globisporangium ultimum (strain ATCC 200006 / CBS 805.95 / DAOM BR144) TaxID=431595 RepID=K3WJL4_GLOUD